MIIIGRVLAMFLATPRHGTPGGVGRGLAVGRGGPRPEERVAGRSVAAVYHGVPFATFTGGIDRVLALRTETRRTSPPGQLDRVINPTRFPIDHYQLLAVVVVAYGRRVGQTFAIRAEHGAPTP